jgi:hypothetical protein
MPDVPYEDDDLFAAFGDQYDHEWEDLEEPVPELFTGLPSWCDFGKPSIVDPKQFSQRISVPGQYAVGWARCQPPYRTAIEVLGEAGVESSRRYITWAGECWVGSSGIDVAIEPTPGVQRVHVPATVRLYWHRGIKGPVYPTPGPKEEQPADIVEADEKARFGLLELNALPIGKAVNVTVQASVKTVAAPTVKNLDYTITTVTVSCLRKVSQFENDRIEMTAAIEKNTDPIDVAHHLRELCLKAIKP